MTIQIGDKIPQVSIKAVSDGEILETNTETLFATGKAVLFGVPGAFTPTCSQAHLPEYVDLFEAIKAKGVDKIVCMSVNDAFVMKAWADASDAHKIIMLADGSADFTEQLGLQLDASTFGMGLRCQRFAMIIEDGAVKQCFVEQPKQFEVSKAEYILEKL
ncbi:peroxiredoxin [Aliikangiella maris]|uniref:Glutathione-dependent peroxiredoxin n=2 Tax=Aliikangiella maris TaxID=3162458 RepID=A0ABV3MP10_9GAMM